MKVSIVGSLRDREVACSASDRQGSNFESCVWRTVSSQSSHHPQEALLAQFSLYVHKGGLKPDSFYLFHAINIEFLCNLWVVSTICNSLTGSPQYVQWCIDSSSCLYILPWHCNLQWKETHALCHYRAKMIICSGVWWSPWTCYPSVAWSSYPMSAICKVRLIIKKWNVRNKYKGMLIRPLLLCCSLTTWYPFCLQTLTCMVL